MNRRKFITSSIAGSTLVSFGGLNGALGAINSTSGEMPYAILGRTGEKVSRLGVGGGRFMGEERTAGLIHDILHRAVELGINYVDTAPNYGNAQEKMGPAIHELRDKIFLVTKVEESTYEGVWLQLKQSLKDLQTDHLDLVHMHSFGNKERWADIDFIMSKKGALYALTEAKEKGVIGYIGLSTHNAPSRCMQVIESDLIDVIMVAVNFVVQHVYDFEHALCIRAAQKNLGQVAMKMLGGATENGIHIPAGYYEKAIHYALSIPGMHAGLIGFEKVTEVEQAVQAVKNFHPLLEEEQFSLYQKGLELLAADDSWKAPYGMPVL